MKIGTLNTNGFVDSAAKRSLIFNLIENKKLDIICLQETHFNCNDNLNEYFKDFKGQYFVNSVDKGRKQGVAILFKASLDVSVIKIIKDKDGRTLSLLCQFNDNMYINIVCVYAPNNPVTRGEYLANCNQYFVTNHGNRPVTDRIVCGDFNCIDDILTDRSGQKTATLSTTVGAREFHSLCDRYDLSDVFTQLHPDRQSFTHLSKAHKTYTRIDKVFVSISLLNDLKQTEVSQCFYSDHRLVWAELSNNVTLCKGPGLWVMNNSILNDNVYQTIFSEFWENWKLQKVNFINLSMWWDIGKKRIKSLTIDYCKEKRRTERTYIQHLKHIEKHLTHLSELGQIRAGARGDLSA